MAFKIGMLVDLHMTSFTLNAHFDDRDLDAMSQWLGRGNNSALNYLENLASNKHDRLNSASRDLDVENISMA